MNSWSWGPTYWYCYSQLSRILILRCLVGWGGHHGQNDPSPCHQNKNTSGQDPPPPLFPPHTSPTSGFIYCNLLIKRTSEDCLHGFNSVFVSLSNIWIRFLFHQYWNCLGVLISDHFNRLLRLHSPDFPPIGLSIVEICSFLSTVTTPTCQLNALPTHHLFTVSPRRTTFTINDTRQKSRRVEDCLNRGGKHYTFI